MAKTSLDMAKTALAELAALDPNSLKRVDELGSSLGFLAVVHPLIELQKMFGVFSDAVLAELSESQREELVEELGHVLNEIRAIRDFKASQGVNERDQLIKQVLGRPNHIREKLHRQLTTARVASILPEAAREEFARLMRDASLSITDTKMQQESLLKQIKAVAAASGVSQNAVAFKQAADDHKRSARGWLGWSIFSAALLMVWAICGARLLDVPLDLGGPEWLSRYRWLSARVLVFGVLAYATVTCVRNFTANRHNMVINLQRQHALQTYEVLIAGAATDGLKEIIMEKAASAIFSPQETGYAKGGSEAIETKTTLDLVGKAQ